MRTGGSGQARLAGALAAAPQAVIVRDATGTIVFVNAAAERLLGRSATELIGRRVHDVAWGIVDEDGQPVAADDNPALRALRTGRSGPPTLGGVRRDGAFRWVRTTVVLLTDGDETVGVASYLEDVTRSRVAEHQRRELLETMSDAYYAVDERWRMTVVNARAVELLRVPAEQLLGRPLAEVFPEALGGEIEQRYRQVLTTGQPQTFETFYAPHERWYEIHAYPVDGGLAAHFRDVSQQRRVELERDRLVATTSAAVAEAEASRAALERAAHHDALTGLPNREGFLAWAERTHPAPSGRERWDLGVLLLDLDRFRHLNDVLGHLEGDRLLREVARRLRRLVGQRGAAFLGRLTGDEYLIATRAVTVEALLDLAERILAELRRPIGSGDDLVVLTGTIGAAFAPHGRHVDVLRDADSALARAKEAGGDQVALFDESRRRRTSARLRLENDLRVAVERRQLGLHHQPFYLLGAGRCGGSEALLRWDHPAHGAVPPSRFVPVAEETGLIVPLGELVVAEAITLAAAPHGPPGNVWCNVSGRQLQRSGFAEQVLERIEEAGLARGRFGVEVTESALIEDLPEVTANLRTLSSGGVQIAIDDFGTGYSSLARLSSYPVDLLKIDRRFVADLARGARPLVAAITDLGHALGVAVCAEGVEAPEQLAVLREVGVDQVCGYLLGRPARDDQLPDVIAAGERVLAGG